jgi:hypothetical protein
MVAPSRRTAALRAWLLLLAGLTGCPRTSEGPAARCFEGLIQESSGLVRLTSPVACGAGSAHYRVEGREDRPERIAHLDGEGREDMRLELTWSPEGRPLLEERWIFPDPEPLRVYDRGQRWEFRTPAGDARRAGRIRTELDPAGRPARVTKWVGERLEYTIERRYAAGGLLEREWTREGDGRLRLERRFELEGGRRFERILDGQGKLLLVREAPPGSGDGALDNPGGSPVKDGPTSK